MGSLVQASSSSLQESGLSVPPQSSPRLWRTPVLSEGPALWKGPQISGPGVGVEDLTLINGPLQHPCRSYQALHEFIKVRELDAPVSSPSTETASLGSIREPAWERLAAMWPLMHESSVRGTRVPGISGLERCGSALLEQTGKRALGGGSWCS
jgi:hypothetical protein